MRYMRADFTGLRPIHQVLDPNRAEPRVSPHRLAGAHAEQACPLDQQEVGAGHADAAGEADDEDARAPGDTAQAVLKYLAADWIEHHVGAAPLGDALDSIAKWLARIQHQMIGPPRLRHRELFFGRSRRDHG